MSADQSQDDPYKGESYPAPPPERPGPIEPTDGPTQSKADPHGGESAREQNRRSRYSPQRIMAILTAIIALATIVNVAVAYKQWRAMDSANKRSDTSIRIAEDNLALSKTSATSGDKSTSAALDLTRESLTATKRSVALAEQQLVAVQRAFVYPTGLAYELLDGDDLNRAVARIQVRWGNSGGTPTRDLYLYVNSQFMDRPLPRNYGFPDLDRHGKITTKPDFVRSLLAPKAGLQMAHTAIVHARQMLQVSAGRLYLYFWGWARYRDVFADTSPHITKFCYRVTNFVSGDAKWSRTLTSESCDQHNCADEECDKAGSQRN